MSWLRDLAIMVAAFVLASALAGLLGARNLGTALTFGQIAFAIAAVAVIAGPVRRRWRGPTRRPPGR